MLTVFSQTNTFQMVLATDEVYTYIIFNYAVLNWLSHTEAGGDTTKGEGGVPAYVSGQTIPFLVPSLFVGWHSIKQLTPKKNLPTNCEWRVCFAFSFPGSSHALFAFVICSPI